MNIAERYRKISDEVSSAATACGRDPRYIRILAVSKTVPHHVMQEAIDSGIMLFGENRIQEARAKIEMLHGVFSCHMIGHLQSNKSTDAVRLFDLIHSVDKVSTAHAVDLSAKKINKIQDILIQIKTHNEATKSGISPEESLALAESILKMDNLKLLGVMTIGPITDDNNITRLAFRETRLVMERINREFGVELDQLSMGMSGDFRIAIEEGSTILRIGSSIFGERI